MGRQSGFIAMQASMASGIVDCCLIPEISFNMDKVNEHISNIIERNGHCVICVAEGAGQVRSPLTASKVSDRLLLFRRDLDSCCIHAIECAGYAGEFFNREGCERESNSG